METAFRKLDEKEDKVVKKSSDSIQGLNDFWKGKYVHRKVGTVDGLLREVFCYVNSISRKPEGMSTEVVANTLNPIIIRVTDAEKKVHYEFLNPCTQKGGSMVIEDLPSHFLTSIRRGERLSGDTIAEETYKDIYKAAIDYFGVLWQSV